MSLSDNKFSYRGTEIDVKFTLGEEQSNALKDLIDYVLSGDLEPITLSGSAGSGKTSIIRYLDDFIYKHRGFGYNFLYAAPTHAATVYLGLNLGFLPYTLQSIMINRYDSKSKRWKKSFSSKFQLNPMKQNVLIIDESSMISNEDLKDLLNLSKKCNLKIIFLGDKYQIPEVSTNKVKQISDVFTKIDNISLTKVHRTSNDDILKVLNEIIENPDGYLPIISNTDNIKFYNQINKPKFYIDFLETYIKEPEDTVFITYTNNSIKIFNNSVRKDIYGSREGLKTLFVGETIIGYGGYNNKTVAAGHLANSIRFKVESVTKKESYMIINAFSKIANSISPDLGKVTTNYLQLSLEDSIVFNEITNEDMENNNRLLSSIFRKIYYLKRKALHDSNWKTYFIKISEATKPLCTIDLGNAYIYNPNSSRMEIFNIYNATHKDLKSSFPELYIDKGVDFGYAITIHKSQGSTYKNVFFDSSSTEKNNIVLMANDEKVGTEGNSLNYVGMSRAKENLFVLYGSKIKRLD